MEAIEHLHEEMNMNTNMNIITITVSSWCKRGLRLVCC